MSSEDKRSNLVLLKKELETLNVRIDEISGHVNKNKKIRERLLQKKSRLVEIEARLKIMIARLEERKTFNINKMSENTLSIETIIRSLREKEAETKSFG